MNFEKLNGTNCRISDIQNGDKILIGGAHAGLLDLSVRADTNYFEPFFKWIEKKALSFTVNLEMTKWVNGIAPQFDTQLFSHLYAFDNVLRKTYPDCSANLSKRRDFYDTKGTKTLSEAINSGVCQCAEIATLAQIYLQRTPFKTTYFGGEFLQTAIHQFSERHSFITIQTEKKDYIYDPANPRLSFGTYLPTIGSVEATPEQKKKFESIIHTENEKRNCAFLETKDILTGKLSYYGCGDREQIFPTFILSKNDLTKTLIKQKMVKSLTD